MHPVDMMARCKVAGKKANCNISYVENKVTNKNVIKPVLKAPGFFESHC